MCKSSGLSPSSIYKTTLKQQLNAENDEKWDEKLNHLSVLGWAMLFFCPLLGRLWDTDEWARNGNDSMVTEKQWFCDSAASYNGLQEWTSQTGHRRSLRWRKKMVMKKKEDPAENLLWGKKEKKKRRRNEENEEKKKDQFAMRYNLQC